MRPAASHQKTLATISESMHHDSVHAATAFTRQSIRDITKRVAAHPFPIKHPCLRDDTVTSMPPHASAHQSIHARTMRLWVKVFTHHTDSQVDFCGFADSPVRKFADSRVSVLLGSRVHGLAGSQIPGFASFRDFADSQVRGFGCLWIHGIFPRTLPG